MTYSEKNEKNIYLVDIKIKTGWTNLLTLKHLGKT